MHNFVTGGLIFGYDIAGAGATFVMTGFQEHFGWKCAQDDLDCVPKTEDQIQIDQGLINGLFGAGATVGAIMNPYLADRLGRKPSLAIGTVVFIFGASFQAGASGMTMMTVARLFSGYGIGSLSMCSPVYISECAPDHVRGMLATLWQLAITFGILVASAANLGLMQWDEGWRISYGGNILFAIFLLVALIFMPESPRWLAARDKGEELRVALGKVRFEEEIDTEIAQLKAEVQEEKERGVASWSEVFAKDNKMRYRLWLGIGLQAVQQLSGINAIMFYAPNILKIFFGEKDAVYGTFVLNAINFLSTFITVFSVDKFGRVKLMLSGGLIMCTSLIANSILSSFEGSRTIGYIVVIFSSLYIIGFAYSWGPVVWVVCSEMFPLRARGKATGLTTMTNWLFTTIVGAVFPIASSRSLPGCFGFFACVIFAGSWMVYFFEAETANRSILEIDEEFKKHEPKLKRRDW